MHVWVGIDVYAPTQHTSIHPPYLNPIIGTGRGGAGRLRLQFGADRLGERVAGGLSEDGGVLGGADHAGGILMCVYVQILYIYLYYVHVCMCMWIDLRYGVILCVN